jgi:uncharacterized membrane protein YkvA (DUF1232 family)
MADYFKLVLRLMADRRVSFWLKLLPVGGLVYLINPIDIPGPLDDAGIIGLSLYLFVELCPPEVVEEHRQAIHRVIPGEWRNPDKPIEGEVIDGEFREEK